MSLKKWNDGADLLMFLKRVSGETNRFEPYGGSAGLFRIEAGQRIRSLLRHGEADREFEQLTLDEVVLRIKQQAKR